MALQSQAPRAQSVRSVMSGGGGLGGWWSSLPGGAKIGLLGAGVTFAGLCALVVYFLAQPGPGPGAAGAGSDGAAGTDAARLAQPAGDPLAAAAAREPGAMSGAMSGGRAEETAPGSFEVPAEVIDMSGRDGGGTLVPALPASTPGTTPGGAPGSTPGGAPGSSPGSAPGGGPGVAPGGAPSGAPGTGTGVGPDGLPLVAPPPPPAPDAEARGLIEQGNRELSAGRRVEARTLLNRALADGRLGEADRQGLREQIAAINQTLVFGREVAGNDPLFDTYVVQSGDTLVGIVKKLSLPVDWRFVQRVNGLANPNALRVGQKLKIVRQPFHAVVDKSGYRMDVYAGEPISPGTAGRATGPDGQEPGWLYVRSFRVGLGESNGTPEGAFVVRPRSKLVNPRWVNPRTGEKFDANDPKNPIGEHWLGLDGLDESTRAFTGYGLHGTIEPESIGQQRSMGCVRMQSEDIALIYEMLVERISTVRIVR